MKFDDVIYIFVVLFRVIYYSSFNSYISSKCSHHFCCLKSVAPSLIIKAFVWLSYIHRSLPGPNYAASSCYTPDVYKKFQNFLLCLKFYISLGLTFCLVFLSTLTAIKVDRLLAVVLGLKKQTRCKFKESMGQC